MHQNTSTSTIPINQIPILHMLHIRNDLLVHTTTDMGRDTYFINLASSLNIQDDITCHPNLQIIRTCFVSPNFYPAGGRY